MVFKERNKAVPAVYLVLEDAGSILVGLRQNTGYEDGMYQVFAGHVEEGELPKEAMIREANEELGITLYPDDLFLAHTMYRAKRDETGDRADYFSSAGRRPDRPGDRAGA